MNKDNSKIHSDVIIVGGGPAGSACARDLARAGYEVTILDKAKFPRDKLCAGWVLPSLFRRLRIEPSEYPGGLHEYRALHFRIKGFPIALPTRQYAIFRPRSDRLLLVFSQGRRLPNHRHRGKQAALSRRRESIREHWDKFVLRLNRAGLVHDSPWNGRPDAAGTENGSAESGTQGHLLTPAGHSGLPGARAIIESRPLRTEPIKRRSLPDILRPGRT